LICLLLCMATSSTLFAQAVETDSELFERGFAAYSAHDDINAAVYLFAYMQRNPQAMVNDPRHARSVREVYAATISNVQSALTQGKQAQQQLASLQQNERGVGSSSSGITNRPRLERPSVGIGAQAGNQVVDGRGMGPQAGASINLDGEWQFVMRSTVSGNEYRGRFFLQIKDKVVTARMETPDGSGQDMTGTVVADSIDLARDTGRSTTQRFRLAVKGPRQLTGRFWNEGRYQDQGVFELNR
jgi:hypothetical protein